MYKNIFVEQEKQGYTNACIADELGISELLYSRKLATGNFVAAELIILSKLFNCSIDYLLCNRTA